MIDAAHKERYNLYYIFAADKKKHPMPEHKVDAIRAAIFSYAPPKTGFHPNDRKEDTS